MRLPLLAFAVLSLAAPATAATRNFGIEDFDRIRIAGPFKVQLVTGVAPFAKATGSNDAIDGVSIEVQGRTLIVRRNSSNWSSFPGQNSGPVTISIGTHDLSVASLNGSGVLAIDHVKGASFQLSVDGAGSASIGNIAVDTLDVGISGSASATIAGTAPQLTANLLGASSFDGSALSAKDATIGAHGTAVVKLIATDAVKVDADGPVTLTFGGNPACMLRSQGPADVTGCRSEAP
jgi:hypothetical protein